MQYEVDEDQIRKSGDWARQLALALLKPGMNALACGVLLAVHITLYLVQHTPGLLTYRLLESPFAEQTLYPYCPYIRAVYGRTGSCLCKGGRNLFSEG